MAIDPAPKNDEILSESPAGDGISAGLRLDNLTDADNPFNSSLSEWRSAMKAMGTGENNIQVAGMGSSVLEYVDSFRKWLWPSKPGVTQPDTDVVKANSLLESFNLNDLINIRGNLSEKDKRKPPPLDSLPVGGPQLEGKSKEVVTSIYTDSSTANLETFDSNALTAAHRTLPFNTIVDLEYRDPKTGVTKIVRGVRINDDGPHVKGDDSSPLLRRKPRELDVSPRVAKELGFAPDGVGVVKMTIVKWGDNKYANGGVHPAGTDFRNKDREAREFWGRSSFSIYK